jgi:NAD-dependent dihydropyrimidine dehydrogenase PreA subunit
VIYVDKARCTGCAACMGLCPNGAIAIEDGVAVIAEPLCSECGDCLEACPQRAIIIVATVSGSSLQTMSEPRTDISRLRPRATTSTVRQQLGPAARAVLEWAGRELLPRLANLALDWFDQQSAGKTAGLASNADSKRSTRRTVSADRTMNGKRRRERRRQRRGNR